MSDYFMLSDQQMARIAPLFPLAHGVPRADDRKVISAMIYVIQNGLSWHDLPAVYGPHKTAYNRFVRWSKMGLMGPIFDMLAAGPDKCIVTSQQLRAHRTAASLIAKGYFSQILGANGAC